ncbi:hypothetical protein Tco_1456736 [Tanacetum coccineum]
MSTSLNDSTPIIKKKIIQEHLSKLKSDQIDPNATPPEVLESRQAHFHLVTTQSGIGHGKGLTIIKGVKVDKKKKKVKIRVPRKKHTKTIIEETDQTEELANSVNLKEAETTKEEHRLNERHSSLVIGEEVNIETDEGTHEHSTTKLKGFENVSNTTQFLLDMKKASKASRNEYTLQQRPEGPGEGSSVVLETPDDQNKSDNERTKTDNFDDARKEQEAKDQDLVEENVIEQTTIPPSSPSHTLSYAKYGNQLLYENVVISMNDILQDPIETQTQSMVDVPIQEDNPVVQETQLVDVVIILKKLKKPEEKVDAKGVLKRLMKLEKKVEAMSKIDHTKEIDKSVQAHIKNVLPKAVPDFGKIKQEKDAKKNMPKSSTTLKFNENSLKEYDLKNDLLSLMMKSKSFKTHPSHKKLILQQMIKRIQKRDTDATSSKKNKDQVESSKEDKDTYEASKNEKAVDAKESIHDDVVDGDEPRQENDAPKPDTSANEDGVYKSKWFKQDANPEGGRCPYDLTKPLPLQGPPDHKTVPVDFFFNKDLEYLKIGNKEKKYVVSLTKPKDARYELEVLEEMIPKLWSSSKVKYDLNATLGIHH